MGAHDYQIDPVRFVSPLVRVVALTWNGGTPFDDADAAGTQASENLWAAHSETVFPLLGAIGEDTTRALVIGDGQRLVEGPADAVYLTVMSDMLRAKHKVSLDPRWTLTAVGGLDEVATSSLCSVAATSTSR